MLLSVDQGHPVDVVVLVMVSVFISAHDEFLFGSLEPDRPNRLVAFGRDVDVGHVLAAVLIVALVAAAAVADVALTAAQPLRDVTGGADVRQHGLDVGHLIIPAIDMIGILSGLLNRRLATLVLDRVVRVYRQVVL